MGNTEASSANGTRRLASILALDICDFSKLAETHEDTAIAVVKRLRTLVVDISSQFNGRLFHEAGDAFFFEFASASQTMSCAKEILKQVSKDIELNALARTKVRIGLHTGDVHVEADGNLLGHGVNVAARLQDSAQPGSILASTNLIEALSSKQPTHRSRRKVSLKNIKKPMIAFDIAAIEENTIARMARSVFYIAGNPVGLILACLLLITATASYWTYINGANNKLNSSAVSATLYHLKLTSSIG